MEVHIYSVKAKSQAGEIRIKIYNDSAKSGRDLKDLSQGI